MLHEDRVRAGAFGQDAVRYDRARPGYPTALIERLLEAHPKAVLDVGCGTGLAARALLRAGVDVLGVEPDARMAEVAQASGVQVEAGTFEDWSPAGRRFDLLTCAQAWHWVDPVRGPVKAADVVRPGGRAALFWNIGRLPADAVVRFDAVYGRVAPGLDEYAVLLGRGELNRAEQTADAFSRHDAWRDVTVEHFSHTARYATGQWLDHLLTHPDHGRLEQDRREQLFAELAAIVEERGGQLDVTYDAVLTLAVHSA